MASGMKLACQITDTVAKLARLLLKSRRKLFDLIDTTLKVSEFRVCFRLGWQHFCFMAPQRLIDYIIGYDCNTFLQRWRRFR